MGNIEHWCDYCGTGFNGRAYHGIDGLPDTCETACAHCVVEVLLAQRYYDRGAVEDAATGRALIDRMFELPRGPEWEQALAELRVWCMDPQQLRGR